MVTAEDRQWLRRALDERIPEGGTESDTRFTDAELNELLDANPNKYLAAAEGWMLKAGFLQSERAGLEKYKAGDESYDYVRLKDAYEHAINMANYYQRKGGLGSLLMTVKRPDVLHLEDE